MNTTTTTKIIGGALGLAALAVITRGIYISQVPPSLQKIVEDFSGNKRRVSVLRFGDNEIDTAGKGTGIYGGYSGILAQLTGADKKWALKVTTTDNSQEFVLLKDGVAQKEPILINDTGTMLAEVWEDKTGFVKNKKLVKPKGLLFQLTNRLKLRF